MNKIAVRILVKLLRNGYWGRRLINFDDLIVKNTSTKQIAIACKNLEGKGLLIRKPGLKGFRYSLNPSKAKEINEIYDCWLRKTI